MSIILGIIIVISLITAIFKLSKIIDLLIDIKFKHKEEIENSQAVQRLLVTISDQIFNLEGKDSNLSDAEVAILLKNSK